MNLNKCLTPLTSRLWLCWNERSHNGGGWTLEFHWNYLQSLHTKQARVFLAYTQTCWEEEEEEGEEKEEEEEEEEAVSAQSRVITISQKGDCLFLQSIPG